MSHGFGKIAAIIVTYNCGEEFRANLAAISPQVDAVVIVDNSTEQASNEFLQRLVPEHTNVKLLYNGRNVGLGAAQNIGIRLACHEGAEWMLLLDDDSRAEPDMIAAMWRAYEHNPERERIGICAPLIVDANGEKNYRCLLPRGKIFFQRKELREHEYLNGVLCVMASGSLIRRRVFERIGLMREDFFIDYIDWEFCLRMILGGWIIMAVSAARLNHNLGRMTTHRMFGRSFITTNHPASRRYTNARNRTIFWRLYVTRVPLACTLYNFMASVYEYLLILLFEEQKITKAAIIIQGVWDGLRARNIRIAPPQLEFGVQSSEFRVQ